MKKINVSVKIINDGFGITVNNKKYFQKYPLTIWQNFPRPLRKLLAQSAAVFFTSHLAVTEKGRLNYDFPPPSSYSLFFHGLVYSLLEIYYTIDHPLDALKRAIDVHLDIKFRGLPPRYYPLQSAPPGMNMKTVLLFTFGKDSLLTFGLVRELGLETDLYFFNEPYSPYEYSGRLAIRKKFEKHFTKKIHYIDLNLGKLRQNGGEMWGWDMIILEYLLILTPFMHQDDTRYVLIANEYNNNEININADKMRIFYRFEQNSQWTLNSNHLLRLFGLPTDCVSLIEPLYEYMTTYILHHRYPDLSEYHLSCCADDPTSDVNRWCHLCPACARIYIFLKSLNFDPRTIGFKEDMLKENKIKYFDIFDKKDEKISNWKKFLDAHSELLLAFYVSSLRGVTGDLMDLFKKIFIKKVEEKRLYLLDRVTKLYSSFTLPEELKPELKGIFSGEISSFRKEVKQLF